MVAMSAAPAALADITAPTPTVAAPAGNCDLLAANTVRAALRDVRDITTQSLDQDQPVTTKVAVFEVIENLAYKKYVRYGDGRLEAGTRFTVELSKDIPGQPADVADKILQMKQGEEAVLKMVHLYMLGNGGNDPVRACSRIACSGQDALPHPSSLQNSSRKDSPRLPHSPPIPRRMPPYPPAPRRWAAAAAARPCRRPWARRWMTRTTSWALAVPRTPCFRG